MTTVLFVDSETTGLPDFKLPADDPAQPRLIELAWIALEVESRIVLESQSWLIVPETGMPADLAEKMGHGLTQEMLEAYGRAPEFALSAYERAHDTADMLACWNQAFDLKVLRGELRRHGYDDRYGAKPVTCVMRSAHSTCAIPKADGKGIKFPKLEEAVEILLPGQTFGHHRALEDCRAMVAIYLELLDRGVEMHVKQHTPSEAAA